MHFLHRKLAFKAGRKKTTRTIHRFSASHASLSWDIPCPGSFSCQSAHAHVTLTVTPIDRLVTRDTSVPFTTHTALSRNRRILHIKIVSLVFSASYSAARVVCLLTSNTCTHDRYAARKRLLTDPNVNKAQFVLTLLHTLIRNLLCVDIYAFVKTQAKTIVSTYRLSIFTPFRVESGKKRPPDKPGVLTSNSDSSMCHDSQSGEPPWSVRCPDVP